MENSSICVIWSRSRELLAIVAGIHLRGKTDLFQVAGAGNTACFLACRVQSGEQHPCQDYVELVLTDNAPVMLAAERLRPFYPNLLSVSNLWMAATVTGERAAKLKGQNERTVLTSFLKEVCGTEAEPQDLALFQEVLEELRAE